MLMIHFAPAKINLGLHVLERRADGYHNLQTVMVPTGLCDLIEITKLPEQRDKFRFEQTGIPLEEGSGVNLCVKARELMAREVRVPSLLIHLHKQIPVGAGLGGGSSDATHTLIGINRWLEDPLPEETLHTLATSLGSDCPFFLHGKAMLAEGRGEILTAIPMALQGYWLLLFHSGVHISTAEAYSGIQPSADRPDLRKLLDQPIQTWKDAVVNDFEYSVFREYPGLPELKELIYAAGAVYASMSGSGSAMYGLFTSPPLLTGALADQILWRGVL